MNEKSSLEKKAREFVLRRNKELYGVNGVNYNRLSEAEAAAFAVPYEAALRELVEAGREITGRWQSLVDWSEFEQALASASDLLGGGNDGV